MHRHNTSDHTHTNDGSMQTRRIRNKKHNINVSHTTHLPNTINAIRSEPTEIRQHPYMNGLPLPHGPHGPHGKTPTSKHCVIHEHTKKHKLQPISITDTTPHAARSCRTRSRGIQQLAVVNSAYQNHIRHVPSCRTRMYQHPISLDCRLKQIQSDSFPTDVHLTYFQ